MESREAIFRSAEMSLVQFYISNEIARDIVSLLGDQGMVHFIDLNANVSQFQRSFIKEIRNFDAIQSKLANIFSIIESQESSNNYKFLKRLNSAPSVKNYSNSEMEDVINKINFFENKIVDLDSSYHSLKTEQLNLIEKRYVINGIQSFFDKSNTFDSSRFSVELEQESLLESGLLEEFNQHLTNTNHNVSSTTNLTGLVDFGFITGTIAREKISVLQRILWRTLRGNLFFHDMPISESLPDKKANLVDKSIFVIFVHGETLKLKAKRIIDSLDGKVFQVDNNSQVNSELLDELNRKLEDLNEILDHTSSHLNTELISINKDLLIWDYIIKKEISLYKTLNKFNYDSTRKCLIAEGWIPQWDYQVIKNSLRDFIELSNGNSNLLNNSHSENLIAVINQLTTNKTPPTYHKLNKFTKAFQAIIDAYGIATYREVNPGLATIVTFPFMFAIMFGDLGHGAILALIALSMVINERSIARSPRDEIFDMAFSGRYILLLMGVFSMYTGFLYNDLFSKSMTIFRSGWEWPSDFQEGDSIEAKKIGVYFFGLDWAWHGAENNLLFTNSYKMKLSILMGYVHMTYSFLNSYVNYKFFDSKVDMIGNFIPGLVFMQGIFGYLSLTIVYKWCKDWIAAEEPAPGLLNMLINMFLSPGSIDVPLYKGQKFVQVVLVMAALVCVPWLLLYKPLTLRYRNNLAVSAGYSDLNNQNFHNNIVLTEEETGDDLLVHDLGDHDEPFDFGDVMIHQVIHTIEFCLNCVSHTASYLRLWALSLAHAQLSSVLWTMTIANSFGSTGAKGIIMTVILFGMWFVLTVCILVVMEGTSAMLHSLRLHWVEAMSKFFEGNGYAYEPFDFNTLLDAPSV